MKPNSAQSLGRLRLIWFGLGLSLLFLVSDIFIQIYVFGQRPTAQLLFSPASYEVWMRTLVIGVILIFTIYAQRMTARLQANRTRLEQELQERQRVESQLNETLSLNRRIIETSLVGMLMYQADSGQCVMANEAAAQAAGASIEQLRAQTFRALESWKNTGLLSIAEQVLSDGQERRVDVRMTTTFGKDLWLDCMFSQIGHAGRPHLLFMLVDITARKRAEEALAQERNLLRTLIDAMPDYIYGKDTDGRFILSNLSHARLRGVATADALIGRTDFDFYPRELAEKYRASEEIIFREGHSLVDAEEPNLDVAGQLRFTTVTKMPLRDDQGRVVGLVGITHDITARKQLEAALRDSEQRYREIFEASPDAIYLLEVLEDRQHFRIIDVNLASEKITGIVRAELIGKTIEETLSDETAPAFNTQYRQCVAARTTCEEEIELNLPMGRRIFRSTLIPILEVTGQVHRIIGITLDITEHRRAEEALQYRAAQLALLADVGSKIAAVLDLKSVLNQAARLVHEYFGYHHVALFTVDREQRELVMRARAGMFAPLFPIDHRIKLGQGVVGWTGQYGDRLLANDVRAEPRYFNRYPDRIPTQAEFCVPIRIGIETVGVLDVQSPQLNAFDDDDIVVLEALANQIAIAIENSRLYEAIQQELAARKQAEAELLNAKEAAESAAASAAAANRAKSAFLANMSHELRTPLNAILGFSDLMTRDPQLSIEQRENLTIINHSGAHLLSLINDVLDMAKIESGRLTLQAEAFDLHRLLEGLVEMFYLRAVDKGLTLIVDRAPEVPRYVRADQGKLRQVLINLLGNAVKFTTKGGVGLRIRQIAALENICQLEFEVQDTGPGIAPAELETVFEPFVQLADGVKAQSGTGLGLSISRQFARLMGGDLVASNADVPGLGAIFKFKVPVGLSDPTDLPNHTQSAQPVAIRLQPGQPAYRLLVVEDHEESRKLMVILLTQLGFEVRAAANGLEGFNTWREWQPHLIWMDIRMPIMDGHDATHQIKATPQGQATIIIALTASAFEDERAQVLLEGCDDYVRKPFRASEVADRLVKHLGVQFVYQSAAAGESAPAPRSMGPLDLSGLTGNWLADLQLAVIESESDQVLKLIDQIRDQRPALASVLTDLANSFDYRTILDAIQQQDSSKDGGVK